jgi:adenine-specific DNA-methyltransferase
MAIITDISVKYEYVMGEENRKKTGRFYTDKSIIKYMLEDVLKDIDVSQNPYIRILDPSCGCGYFLTQAYDILKERFIRDLDKVNANNPGLNLKIEDIHNHIIENNIYGADLDEYGIKLSITGLMLKSPASDKIPNIICCDSILNWEDFDCPEREFWCRGYDIIIGNPPYIGHKQTDSGYRKKLNSIYGDIFKDKSDISFCFIKSSIDRLVRGGRLCFITSRYFIESPSGRALRGYINQNCIIEKIVDFYGVRIMKGISVDPVISFFRKEQPADSNKIKVIKAEGKLKSLEGDSIFYELKSRDSSYFSFFELSQFRLKDEGWTLCRSAELSIVDK